ncbi:hypothetical protein [Methylobacterium komagatae]
MAENLEVIAPENADFPTPKYRRGQVVFYATVEHSREMLPCPDCLGSRKWKIVTPAGSELEADCQRCGHYSEIRGVPSLRYTVWKASVCARTIGAVEIRAGWSNDPDPIRYMAVETGIGSGSGYREKDLYPDEEAARTAAQAQADSENAKISEKPEQLNQQTFSHLRIEDAAIRAASDAVWNSWYRVNSLVGEIKESLEEEGTRLDDLKEEIERHIDFDREYRAKRDPFENLLEAARRAAATTDLPELAAALAAEPFNALAPSLAQTEA